MPLLTIAQIEEALRNDVLSVTVGGVEYLVTWDEGGTGIFGWVIKEMQEDSPADIRFGTDEEEAAPEIAAWIATGGLTMDDE